MLVGLKAVFASERLVRLANLGAKRSGICTFEIWHCPRWVKKTRRGEKK